MSSGSEIKSGEALNRPTLMGKEGDARSDSILLGIEKSKAVRQQVQREIAAQADQPARFAWPWVLGISGVLAAGLMWWLMASAPGGAVKGREPIVAAPAAGSAGKTLAAAAVAAAPSPVAASVAAPLAVMASASASVSAAPALATAVVAPAAVAAVRAAPVAPVGPIATAARKTAVKPAPKPAVTAARVGNGAAMPASAVKARDPDAELLTAMLGGADNDARIAAAATAAAPGANPALRNVGTIAGLVRGCTAMPDAKAGSVCRQRICDGYWGKAQACPQSLAPKSNGGKAQVKKAGKKSSKTVVKKSTKKSAKKTAQKSKSAQA